MKTRLIGLCAAFGAGGILVVIWYLHSQTPAEGIRLRSAPATVSAAVEKLPIALENGSRVKPRPAAGPRSVPSFGAQKDLWAFVKKAEASDNVAFKYEGYAAARECLGLLSSEFYSDLADKALRAGDQGPYFALAELNKRCEGFAAVGASDRLQLVKTLKAQVATSNSNLSPLVANRELDDEECEAVLRSGGPAAMESVLPRIRSELRSATSLAICDLGKACGPDSFGAQLFCIQTGKCGQALWADAADEYSPEEWQAIQIAREKIVGAMTAGDVKALFKKA